jgi:hypothetical protein
MMTSSQHVYEVRPRKDRRGFDLISDVLPFGRLWYGESNAVDNAIGYAMHSSRSHDVVIRVYDAAGKLIETHDPVAMCVMQIGRRMPTQALLMSSTISATLYGSRRSVIEYRRAHDQP